MPNFSRRGFAGFLLAPLFRLRTQSALPAPAERATGALSRAASRTYRADAVILLLGITVYRRSAVGGGQASLDETGEGDSLNRTLFFAAGSDPKRAVGLRRMGWIREAVLGPASGASEAAYFGVMTSSPEESLEGARKSVDAQPSAKSAFSAVSGRNVPGRSRSAVTHFEYAADALWSDRALIDHAKSTFQGGANWRETSWPNPPNQTPPTFLLLVATLLKQRVRRATGRYVYDEQEYLLDLEMQAAGADRLLPFKGKIRNRRTGKETLFRVWLQNDSDSIVPVRIEFQARSFLRLTFEAMPA
jgi:hypothetical protein